MALLGIVNIASNLPIHARFDVVAVKIYEERTVVAAPAYTWISVVPRSTAKASSMEEINRFT